MEIQWKTGKPDYDGEFIVILNKPRGLVMQIGYTKEKGWNTFPGSEGKSAFPDEDVALWTERFAEKAIDIYVLP